MPGTQAVQRALRDALDAGVRACGCSTPGAASASRRAGWPRRIPACPSPAWTATASCSTSPRREHAPANLECVEGDLTALELPERSFDLIRTERVLMYLPGDAFEQAARRPDRACCGPAGGWRCFELDYGATILAPGSAADAVVERAGDRARSRSPPAVGRPPAPAAC